MQKNQRPLVVVTGSTGFLGTRAAARLRDDYRIVGLDLKAPPDDWPGDDWIECDLTKDDSTKDALEKVRREHGDGIASVLHLAAYYDFSGEPSPLYNELTVEGTRRLVRGLRGFSVGQIAFSSSLLVMKPVEKGEVIDETSETAAPWEYPRSKLDAERVLREEAGDTPVAILRIAGVYDDDCRSLPIAQQIGRIHQKDLESYLFPGNAEHGQPFVHIDDLVRLFAAVVERRDRLEGHETFLVAEPELMTYEELQDRLGELIHDKAWPTIRVPAPVAKAGAKVKDLVDEDAFIKPWMIELADAHYPVSIERARRRLGWEPRRRLEDCLPEMVRRLLEDPEGWYERNGLPVPDGVRD